MIIHNGEAHACAAYCENLYKSGHDDPKNWQLVDHPHPDNWAQSYAVNLARLTQNNLHSMAMTNNTVESMIDQFIHFFDTQEYKRDYVIIAQWPEKNKSLISQFRKDIKFPLIDFTTKEYIQLIKEQGFEPVHKDDNQEFFGREAHAFFSNHLMKKMVDKNLI